MPHCTWCSRLRVLSLITYTTHDSHPYPSFATIRSNVTKCNSRFALEHRYIRDAELLKVGSKTPLALIATTHSAGDGGGVRSLSTTKTSKGITNVDVLVGLSSGRVMALKKRFLDPRRPDKAPSASEKKEMLVQYHPHLPNMPQQVISYNRTISNLQGIVSSNTKLESTSMVLAYGVDLFFARVTPSNAFDRLPDSFNTIALCSLLVGLSIAVTVLRRLLKEKDLMTQWNNNNILRGLLNFYGHFEFFRKA